MKLCCSRLKSRSMKSVSHDLATARCAKAKLLAFFSEGHYGFDMMRLWKKIHHRPARDLISAFFGQCHQIGNQRFEITRDKAQQRRKHLAKKLRHFKRSGSRGIDQDKVKNLVLLLQIK